MIVIELEKVSSLKRALSKIGEDDMGIDKTSDLEKHTLAKFIQAGWNVVLEDSFTAAVRETYEEQGIDLRFPDHYVGVPMEFKRGAITKRTIQNLEKQCGGPLFDLQGVETVNDIAAIVLEIEDSVGTAANVRTLQTLYAIEVPNFDNVHLADSGDKIESKIKGREGKIFHEKGVFMTRSGMFFRLCDSLVLAAEEEAKGNSFARTEIIALYERLEILSRIEQTIIQRLRKEGLDIQSLVPPTMIDKPDRFVTERKGTANPARFSQSRAHQEEKPSASPA